MKSLKICIFSILLLNVYYMITFASCAPEPVKMAFSNDNVSVVYQNGFEFELNHHTCTITINHIAEPGEVPEPVHVETGNIKSTAPGVYLFEGPQHTFELDVPNEGVTTDWRNK